ncbi:MAG: UDP-glucose 4-epimerase [Candidatus Methanomarinus sp.]|jgi:UDP-glucose 4-epimerase|nr:MAG: UDP-glucose 4-epimerase [ANME-2 cluster archaeon]KAF5425705.1 UDP-glucose 4-epimerase [ANME-2 cluster archaeon]
MKLSNKSILVTGGAGFIGSHMVDSLIQQNKVTVFDNLSSGTLEFLKHHQNNDNFLFIEDDLMNPKAILAALNGIDVVFHLAANPDVKLGSQDTRVHLEQNVLATYNLLEAMRQTNTKYIIFTSTSTVYGEALIMPTPEDYGPMVPISLYGASKLACEALISSYCHTFDMTSWLYRFANIVGQRGTHGVVIDFINKLRVDPFSLEILGSGKQKKSYLDVIDCVDAMVYGMEYSDKQVNIFNIGSKDSIDVIDIADIVTERMGYKDVEYRFTGGVDGGAGWKGDVKFMLLSIDKIKKLGWNPAHNSHQSIKMAVDSLLKAQQGI